MKKIFRSAAVAALAAAIVCSGGCGSDTKWSYKSGDQKLTAGDWILNTYVNTLNAVSKIQENDEDATVSSIDFSSKKIEDKTAVKWIEDKAKETCYKELTILTLADKYGVKVEESDYAAQKNMYISYMYSGSSDFYEELGVSEDSFTDVYVKSMYVSDELFKKLYGKGGELEVPDDEIEEYFTKNYVTYYYIGYPLTTTDDLGNTVDLDDSEKEKVSTNFKKYVKVINEQGKTTADVSEQYLKDFETETDPSVSKTEEKSAMTEGELTDEISSLEAGKAKIATIDNTMYFIYRGNIDDKVDVLVDEAPEDTTKEYILKSTILTSMKSDDYDKYLEEQQKELKITKNDDCISKYTVQRTIDIVKKKSEENSSAS